MCSNMGVEYKSFFRTGSQQGSAAEEFFQFDDADNFLLEDYQAPMNSTAQRCLCKCGFKKLEPSNPLSFHNYHGYLPEIEEEVSMPLSYGQSQNEISPFSDEEFSYIPYPRDNGGGGGSMLDDDLEFDFSDPSIVGRKDSFGMSYLSMKTDELVRGRNITERLHSIDIEKEHLMISSSSHFTLQTRLHDGRKVLLHTPAELRRTAEEKFGDYDDCASLADPMAGSRNLRHQGTQSLGFDVQYFHKNHGVLVPTIIQLKRALSNSSSELPSNCSVTSFSSDETDHPQIKVGLYKTELCRSWEETGYCRYAARCQFAHGNDDLRPVPRHPKYKTEFFGDHELQHNTHAVVQVIHRDRTLQLWQAMSFHSQAAFPKFEWLGEESLKEIINISKVMHWSW